MKRHDTPTASGRLPAALLLLALSGPPLRSYTVVTNPLAVTLDAMHGNDNVLYVIRTRPAGQGGAPVAFDALSVAVGWTFRLYISGGLDAEFSPDDEYCRGECGYGYWWPECLANAGVRTCGHALHYGLDADQCRQENSQYLWYSLDGGAAPPEPMPPAYYTTMVEDASGPYSPLPGGHSVTLGFHNAFCVHGRNDMGFGHCHEIIRPHHEAAQPVNVVRMGSVSGPDGFSTCKADSGENGYVRGFSETDWLSLPLGATGSTAVFTAAPYPAAAWPRNTPSWELMAPVQSSVDPDDRAQITVRTDTAFAGGLRAECGTSFISMQLNVVEVAAIGLRWDMELDNEGHCAPEWEDCQYWQNMDDSWDNDYAVLEVRDAPATVYVRAYSNPSLPVRKLPGEWSLTGPQGNDPLYRVLDISTPASTAYAASCGVSSKRLTVHVCGVEADGVTSMVRETDAQTGEVASEYLLLAVPDPANDQMDGTDRRATVALRPLNLLALEGLPLHSWLLMTGGNTGGDGLNHGRLYATCSSGLRFILPGETAEATQAIYDRTEQPCRLLDNLPLGTETTVLVEAFDACTYQRVGHESVTLHYESAVAGFTDALAVKVLDLRTDDIRYLLVNDDNDDMLAYPPDATDEQRQKPFNCVKDKDQQGAVLGEDDLRHISFPFPASEANLPASSLSISVVGNVRLWQDSQRETELVQREWDANEIAQIYGGLDVWVEGLSPSSSIGDVKLTATWDVAGTPISRTVSLTVLEMRMAVDGGKHQENINYDDFGSKEENIFLDFGNYCCIFWPNTDYDVIHEDRELLDDDPAWHEDDKQGVDIGAPCANCDDQTIGCRAKRMKTTYSHDEGTQVTYIPPSADENYCLRDLEDFNRLHLKVDPLFAQLPDVEFHLSGVPVNIFEAIQENLDFLNIQGIAERQAKKTRLLAVGNESHILREKLKFDGDRTPFIWEGRSVCDDDLVLVARLPNGREIGRRWVRIILESIDNYFDTWMSDDIPKGAFNRPEECDFLKQTGDDYILIVHGFNVKDDEKASWAATAYKCLWWQGFKGRMGFFSWPCETVAAWNLIASQLKNIYDDSDFTAHQKGKDLAKLLKHLQDGYCHGKVHLLAHSQGNIVAGEGLRQLDEDQKIKTYIASQAAISISNYVAVTLPYFEESNYPKTGLSHSTPDVRAAFPGWSSQPPYLANIVSRNMAQHFHYFYNEEDYALHSCSLLSWEDDNQMRPNMFYSYSGQSADVYDEAPPSNSVFRHFLLKMDFPQPAGSGGSQNWTPTDMEDTFAILSYAAEAWGKPLGVMPGVTAFGAAFNLSDNNLNYNRYHYSHSRQFRSNIIAEKIYWNKVLDVCLNNQ